MERNTFAVNSENLLMKLSYGECISIQIVFSKDSLKVFATPCALYQPYCKDTPSDSDSNSNEFQPTD